MEFYVINSDVLCFTQDVEDINYTMVVEKKRKLKIKTDSLKLLKKSCKWYGNSYNIQRQFVIDKFNFYIKTPIIIPGFVPMLFFPTSSPKSNECIWLSYNNIDRYVKENDYTKIYFKGGKIFNISVPFSIIDNQITKCIKIEKYLMQTFEKYE